ncbi:MAG: hypothetical protein IKD08_05845 [Alphaproteobacteria bacterium]|nr:hypothetical protein [Alphaproteobacteria bacterium]
MIRILLIYILPLLAPTIIYFIWAKKTKRQDIPWTSLAIAGVILLGLTAGGFSLWEQSPAGSEYTAPKLVDGKIVPAVLGKSE